MADFASEYGIRLGATDLTWREFVPLLTGLLATDTRLMRHFTAKTKSETEVPDGR